MFATGAISMGVSSFLRPPTELFISDCSSSYACCTVLRAGIVGCLGEAQGWEQPLMGEFDGWSSELRVS